MDNYVMGIFDIMAGTDAPENFEDYMALLEYAKYQQEMQTQLLMDMREFESEEY